MRYSGYYYTDVSSCIRLWKKKDTDNFLDINMVILDDDAKRTIIQNQHNFSKDASVVYIEIKGFSNYSDFFDVITCDIFNRYSTLDDITKQFINVLKYFTKAKINIFASRETTIIIPFFINHYNKNLDRIVVINPIYYPYSFHVFYDSVQNKKIDVYLKPNLIKMLNGISLMSLYFDKNTENKKINKLYDNKLNVDFDKDCNLYTDKEILTILLDMYSHVRLDKNDDY